MKTTVDHAKVQSLAETLLNDALAPFFSGDAVCEQTRPTELMTLERGGKTFRIETGHCNDEAIQAARGAVFDLAREAFPYHHVMDPPI